MVRSIGLVLLQIKCFEDLASCIIKVCFGQKNVEVHLFLN